MKALIFALATTWSLAAFGQIDLIKNGGNGEGSFQSPEVPPTPSSSVTYDSYSFRNPLMDSAPKNWCLAATWVVPDGGSFAERVDLGSSIANVGVRNTLSP